MTVAENTSQSASPETPGNPETLEKRLAALESRLAEEAQP